MHRSQTFKRCAWLLLSLSLLSLVIPWPRSLAARPPAPGDAVQEAWRRVQEAGAYHFSSELVETTHPGPALANVGRTSRQEYLYLEGTASLPQDKLQMTLWEGEGSLANHTTGVEILIAGDRAQGRQIGGDWQEIPDFSGAFAPGKDLMGYLAGAENVREVGVENHVLDLTGEAISVEYTHYTFSVNGRDFAAYMRDQMERYLSEKGELPVGVSLGMAETYTDMTGEGHLWVDNDGLPGRLQMRMTYPEMENGDWVEAEIKTDFFGFPASARATANLLEDPQTWLTLTATRLRARLDLPRTTEGWQRFSLHLALVLGCVGLTLLLFSIRHTRRLYPPVALLIIVASVVSPVLQNSQVAAFDEAQHARQVTQAREQEEVERQREVDAALYTSDWNPHQNPANSELANSEWRMPNDASPTTRNSQPTPHIQRLADPAPAPTSDADNDGLTYEHETNLGTNPDDADSDGDGLSDLIEVRGFSYGGHATWYSDPNNPDTNNDGRYDGLECPQRRGACPGGQCPTLLATPCQDSDKDGTPDLFDDDDDNDEVEDRVDMAPLTRNGPFNTFDPFKLKVESDAAGKPLIVDIQLRPTDAAHLTYARNVLDWPSGDQSGQIQRRKGNNSTFGNIANPQPAAGSDDWNGDMRLVPMLEIEMSGKDIPLPLTSIPAQTLSLSGDLKGDITLTHRKSGMASVTDIRGGLTTGGTYTLDLYAGMCMNNNRKRLISFSGTSNSTVNTWNQALTKVADSNHSITVIQGSKSDCVDIYDIPNGPYEDQMFDTRALQEYAISVQDKDANTVLAYVPLNMVPDQSGGGRVAFSARMLYQQSRAEWGKAHAVRLVWWVQMLTDMCQPVPQSITGEAAKKWCDDPTHWIDNQPQVVVTYDDTWTLTGISVREDERVDIGIVYPMTNRAQLLNENMWKLAYGLEKAFVAPLDVNPKDGQRDITMTTIAQRFDRDHNSAVSDQARWGIPRDAFKVATYTYNNLDYIMSVPMTHTKAILADFATTDTPTLMFVREEQSRALTSDDAQAAWESRQTLNLKVTGIPLSTVAGFQWATYRHTTGQGWTMYPLDEYTDKLSYALQQHFAGDPEIYDPNQPEIMQGIILVSQFYALSVCNGITALVQQGTVQIQAAGIPAEDSTIYTAATKAGGIVKSIGSTVVKQLTDVLVELGEIALDQTGNLKNRLIAVAFIFIARKAINVYEKIKSGVNAVKTGINAVKTGLKVAAALWKALASASKPMLGLGIAGAIIGGIGLIGILAVNAGIVGTVLGLQIAFSKDALDAFSRILTPALKLIDVISKVVDIISKSVPGVGSVIALIFSTVIALGVAVVQFIILLASGVNGSVALSALGAGLASAMAGLVLGIIGLLLACTGVGLILLAIVAVIDFLVTLICSMLPAGAKEWVENTATVTHGWVNLCGGISGLLTRAATWGIYSNVKIVTVDDPNRLLFTNFDLYPVTPFGMRSSFTAGNFLNIQLSLRNNLYLTDVGTRIGASWMAMTLGWWQYNLAALRWSTFKYVLSPNAKADVSVGTNQHYTEWRSSATGSNAIFGDFLNYDPGQWYITRDLSAPALPLMTPGINRSDFKMYLVEGYSVYLQECINGIPIFPIGLIPICYVRPEWGARPLPLGDGLVFDIFPATLDAFYQRVAKDGGYALAWSGSAALPFPRLKDADGDGLLNTADGGSDPNDLLWDTDGDGLSDFFETQQGTNPVNADADGDGLNDRRELVLGTDPFRTDSDGDGLSDKAELDGWAFVYGFDAAGQPLSTWVTSDPIKADTDGDTLLDGREKIFGFNPRVVSDPTVLEFNTTLTESAAPQILLRFEDYYGATSFSDLSGYGHSATCTGDTCPTAGVDGQHGAALSFDGVNDHVDISDAAGLHANTFTLAAWFQWDGVGTNAIQFLTGKGTENFEIHTGGGNAADVNNIRVIPAGLGTYVDVPNFIQPGWQHIAVTYDGATTTVYRNGVQVGQHTNTGAANDLTADSAPLRLGMRGVGNYPFAGDLDEVVVFNHVLSPAEIQTVMNARYSPNDTFVKPGDTFHYAGTVANRLYSRYAQGLLSLSQASQATFDMTPRNFILGPRETTTPPLSGDIRVQTNAASDRLHLTQIAGALINDPNEGRRYQYAFQPSLYLSLDDAPGSAHFQDPTGTAIAQCQGVQCPTTGVRGRVNQAAWFDGQDDFVRSDTYVMSSDWGQLGKHAISLWFKTEQGNGTLLKLYGSADGSAVLKQTLYLQNGQLCTTLTSLPVLCAPGTYADGHWHHVAYHFLWGFNGDQTDINMTHALYIDGQNPAQAQYSGSSLWEANTIPVLVRTDIGANFQGTLDEIAIYMGLMDAPQLTTLYQTAPQFHLYLDEPLLTPQGITTTTFVDAAHGNHGVCGGGNPAAASCPDAGSEGQINLAANFDGVDDSLTVPPITFNTGTVSLWYNAKTQRDGATAWIGGDNLFIGKRSANEWGGYWCGAWHTVATSALGNTTGAWNHLVFLFAGADTYVFINGQVVNAITTGACDKTITMIGNSPAVANVAFNGRLDEITVYNRGLTFNEIAAIFQYQNAWVDEQKTITVRVDADAPVATISSLQNGAYRPNADVIFQIDAYDPVPASGAPSSGLFKVEWRVNGGAWQEAPACRDAEPGTAWCPTFTPTGEGTYTLEARGVDAVNNEGAPASVTVYIDATPPQATSATVAGSLLTVQPHPTDAQAWTLALAGAVSDPALPGGAAGSGVASVLVTLQDTTGAIVNEPTPATLAGNTWAVAYTLSSAYATGQYILSVTTADTAGNRASAVLTTFNVDASAPSASLDATALAPRALSDAQAPALIPGQILALDLDDAPGARTFQDSGGYDRDAACDGDACPTAGTAGRMAGALDFDGTDDTVTVAGADMPKLSQFTISAWFQWDDMGTANTQFLTGKGLGNLEIHTGGDTGINGIRAIPAGMATSVDIANFIQPGWNHVAVTYDGATTTVYRNGVAVGTRAGITTGNDLTTDTAPFRLGHRVDGTYPFDGQLDEVRVFERALTAAEVATLAQSPLQQGQVMHLSLDEAAAAPGFSDTSGRSNSGVCSDAPTCPTVTGGQTGNARHFDGADDSLYLGNDASLSLIGDMSFAAWINMDSDSSGNVLLSKGYASEYDLEFWGSRLHYMHSPVSNNGCTFDYTFTPEVWTHLALIRNSASKTVQLYINGQLQPDTCTYTDAPVATRYNVGLGSRVYPADSLFKGAVDDAYLFNRALTADDVALLAAAPAQSGAVMHLSLDDRSSPLFFGDQSGNRNTATCTGDACPTRLTYGKYDAAFDFDGVDDTVTVTDNAALRNPQYTLSAWFRWDDMDTNNVQFLTGKGLGNLEIQTGGDAGMNGLRVIPAGYPATHVDVPNFIQYGWNHIAVTYDGNTTTVYRNGVQMAQRTGITGSNDLLADTAAFRLGQRGDGSYRFDGDLDDVRLYPTVLTPAEIAQLANTLHGAVSELPTVADTVLHLPFEDQAGEKFRDLSGQSHDATCSGTTCPTTRTTGQDGAALTFDGDDVLLVADAPALRNPAFTLSAWFRWDDVGTDQSQFLTAKGLENLEIQTGGAGVNSLRVIPAGYPETHVDVANFIQPGWNHVAVTYDGDKVVVYRNGVQVGERSGITGGNDLTADTAPLRLGVRSDGTYRFDGDLDDVRLFSRALTAAEVAQLAQAQVAGVNGVEVAFEPTMPGSVFYTEPQLPGQRLYLQLDDMPGQSETLTFKDVAGLQWDGTCSGDACPSTGAVGHNGQGVAFDGGNDTISLPQTATFHPTAFSLSMWFQWDAMGTDAVQFLSGKGLGNFEIHTGGDAGVNGLRVIPAGYPGTHVDVADFIQPGWNHVIVTYDGATTTVYRNGAQVAQRTGITSSNNLALDTSALRLSGRITDQYLFDGTMDDVRLFDRALTAAEAAALWRGSDALLHLTFDDARIATGDSVRDSSGWQHNGALLSASGDVLHSTTGHVGNGALTFDGVDDYVEIADTPALRPAAYTLSAWFQWNDVGTNNVQFLTGKTPGNFEIQTGGGNAADVNNIRVIPAGYPASYVDVANFIRPGWNHIAVTYDGGLAGFGATVRVYRNGVLVGTRTGIVGANALSADAAPFRLGLRGDGSYRFHGALDNVQLYPRVLSETEIQAQVMRGWQAATVSPSGSGISRASWSFVLPQGLEGSYRIAARGADMFGQTDARALAQWEGAIDTLAPRVKAEALWLGYATRYTGYAEDFNLDAASYHGPCPTTSLTRQTFAAPWYVALSGATSRLTRISWSCDVTSGPSEVTVCDTDGNCTSVTSGGAGLRPMQSATLAATIFTPTHGTVLTAATPISVSGAAYALNGLDALTVTVNGAAFHTSAWAGAPVSATWATTWTPSGDGVYRLEATVRDTTGAALTETMPITVYVDTQPPTIAIGSSVFTTTHYPPSGMLALTGLVTDATGVQSLEVSTNGADFVPATADGATWSTPWIIGQKPDGVTTTVTARVSDMAGHTVTATRAVTVDLVTPAWVTVTQSPTGTTMTPGTLTLAWTPSSDGSGLDDYRIHWTAQITETPRVAVTTHAAGGSRTATYPVLEGQQLNAQLVSRDTLGNETWQPLGPIYGETALTPDFVTLPGTGETAYRGWMDLGCALVGSDTRIRDEADGGSALNAAQNFYVTWDTASLRMTWTGADWGDPGTAGDGDLFIYLDTMAGGSDRAYNPYTDSMSNTVVLLPARRAAAQPLAAQSLSAYPGGPKAALQAAMTATATEQMQADYLVWVQDSETAVLMAWDNLNGEWRMANGEWAYRFEREQDALYTDLLVPFATLNITNPTATALSLVAFASENDALRLWATMPARNALNSTRLLETQPGGDVQRFALTHRYDWPSLGLGLCPNGTQSPGFVAGYGMTTRAPLAAQAATRYTGADVRLQVSAEPPGLVYSVLEDNLFFIMDDVFEEWMDWDEVDEELCEWFPDDPECEREGETPKSPDPTRMAPTQGGGVDFNAQDSLDILMDVDNPAVGNGDVITYTIHYANQGDAAATGLFAEISTWGPVRLPDGEYYYDDADGSEYYWLELGPYDLAPGETLTLTFNGLIDTAFDPENSFGWATLDVIFYDDTGDIDDNQLDWFYVDHEVDTMPPGISLHAIPALIGPDENTVGGFVSDRSAVPTVTLQILDEYEREDLVQCLDATPEDRAWSCDWDAEGAAEGDVLFLTAFATDKYGQDGNWAPVFSWYTFTVDATPPAVTLDAATLAALSDGLVGPDEMQLGGVLQDNRLFDTVEVCDEEAVCEDADLLADAETLLETTHTYDDVPATPMPLGAGTLCESGNEIVRTFNVAEDFVVADVAVGLNISHEYRLDVDAWLVHPDGGEYRANILWYGTDAENYDVLLRDSNTIVNYADDEDHDVGAPYFENEVHPDELLSIFYGLESAGEWRLVICDGYAEEDDGAYNRSRLILTEATLPENTRATWAYPLSFEDALDGESVAFNLIGEDSVGNRSAPLALSFRVDNVAPVLTVTTALAEVWRNEAATLPVLGGLVSDGDAVAGVSLFGYTPSRVPFTRTATLAGGAWQATLGYTQTGVYDVWVHAADAAGNLTVAGPYPVHLNAPPLLTKSVTPTVNVPLGSIVTYTLRLSNENDVSLPDVRLQDVLPAGVRPLTQTVGTVYLPVGNTLTWGPYTMTRGATFQFVFLAEVTDDPAYSGATLTNTAYVTTTNFGSAQAAAAFTLAESQLFISKTVATAHTPVQLGEAITYTIIVGNRGTGDAADVSVSDVLPEGVGGDALQWTGALAAGEQRTFTLPAWVTTTAAYAGRTLTNTATLHYGSSTLSARAAVTLESGSVSYAIHLPLVLKE